MTNRFRGLVGALVLFLISAHAGHARVVAISHTCGGRLETDLEPSDQVLARSGKLWDSTQTEWPRLSPGQAIRLARDRLIVSGIAGERVALVALHFEYCCGKGIFYNEHGWPHCVRDTRFYVAEFSPLEECPKADSRFRLSIEVVVLMDGTVLLPQKAGQPPVRIPLEAPETRQAPTIQLLRDALQRIVATGRMLERHVRRVALDLQCPSGCPAYTIRVLSYTCYAPDSEASFDADAMAADRFWFRLETDRPRLSPRKAIRLAMEAVRSRRLLDINPATEIGLELRPAGKVSGWYYLVYLGTVSYGPQGCPASPGEDRVVVAAILMDGSVLLPPR